MVHALERLVVRHTLRLPAPGGPAGRGETAARQLDVALLSVGFKLSGELLRWLSGLAEEAVAEVGARTLATVRELVGDHVGHNAYFIDFPLNVPSSEQFWAECIAKALADDGAREPVLAQLGAGVVDLLTLPAYGRYQHSHQDLLAAQPELVAAAGDRLTVLHLGGPLAEEVTALYLALAGSSTPLGEAGLADLGVLAGECVAGPQPEAVPVRESRAVVNLARLGHGAPLLADTVTDVLRLACALSEGDVTLVTPTRFRALPRRTRRALLAALDAVIAAAPARLADVNAHREAFKRLGERLHPHEYPHWPHAAEVFAVARGEQVARSFDSLLEELLEGGELDRAVDQLAAAPGRLLRAVDRLLRRCESEEQYGTVLAAVERAAPRAAGRVLLAVREHLQNRWFASRSAERVFVNQRGRAWVSRDDRPPLPSVVRERLTAVLDAELRSRLPSVERMLVDPAILDVALPLSGRATTGGFGVLPRGSYLPVEGELLRFFVYWKQSSRDTDFDLSGLMLDDKYRTVSWLSYTDLQRAEGEHSGDITEAPDGASEFINLRLGAVTGDYIVPQVNIYSGEGFEEVEESFFGFMLRESEQLGRPFEARTVRMKSELRGPGRVALPLVFARVGDDWYAKWLHFYLKGYPSGNRVENNRVSVAQLVQGVVERQYLTVRYLTGMAGAQEWDGVTLPEGPVTFVGLARPEGLHPDSVVITPENLRDLVPA
ncbi:TerD family protein [Kitasatospora sp. NPDC002227]|uniref:TerD family protein n=1 Tax=Kitasatospora sp. NPDC002227 TaxID=3154773 RepID=UPI003324552C